MANLEIVGKKLPCYLHIYINDNVYCLDKDNCVLNLELAQGKYDFIIIGTKIKDYYFDNSLKSMSFGIKPALFQAYKDKRILNHILGWNNETYFFIKKINIDIKKLKTTINLAVKKYYEFNFFDVKEIVNDIEITTNSNVWSHLIQSFNFVSKKQKIKYYIVQFFCCFLSCF